MNAHTEGFQIALAGGRRADNPYARGWARFSALVLPESEAAIWDSGYLAGLEYLKHIRRERAEYNRANNSDHGR